MSLVQQRKPVPVPDPDSAGYWAAAREHRLAILRCGDCGTYIHYPHNVCPQCWSDKVSWEQVSGQGTIYSFIVVHHKVIPGFEGENPYVVAMVELPEQAALLVPCNIVDCAPCDVSVGMPVEVTFEDMNDQISLPQFRPRGRD